MPRMPTLSRTLLAAAALASFAAPSPASADVALPLQCEITIGFGGGNSSGTGRCIVLDGNDRPVFLEFYSNETPDLCPVLGEVHGTMSGIVDGTFSWVRTGNVAVVRTEGEMNGGGVAVFLPVDPLAYCGGPVTQTVFMTIAGT